MTGAEALAAFEQAKALVKSGSYDEALKVALAPSDAKVIEQRIEAASANEATTKEVT